MIGLASYPKREILQFYWFSSYFFSKDENFEKDPKCFKKKKKKRFF